MMDTDAIGSLSRRHLSALAAIVERGAPGFAADRIVDKLPDNYVYLGLLALLFPKATLIHVRRRARATSRCRAG